VSASAANARERELHVSARELHVEDFAQGPNARDRLIGVDVPDGPPHRGTERGRIAARAHDELPRPHETELSSGAELIERRVDFGERWRVQAVLAHVADDAYDGERPVDRRGRT
jgi:hypothetical protein